jgi:GNAT superfamily N-acetyltransferase
MSDGLPRSDGLPMSELAGAPGSTKSGGLAALLDDVAAGRFPPADGTVTILPQPSPRDAGVFAFTAHSVVFVDADPAWVRGLLPPDKLAGPMLPSFLQALSAGIGRQSTSSDMLCVAEAGSGPPPPITLDRVPVGDHPRLERALRVRDDVRAWQVPGGVLTLGRGVAGRWEVAVEVDPGHRDKGLGRKLIAAAGHLLPEGTPIWAQIAPGNAASVRAFLAAGYQPAGAEVLLCADW